MKVALAPRYRMWMLVLFPTTLGLGTVILWLRSLSWPLNVDESGLTFRHRRRVQWNSVKRICVSRSYLDGHVSTVRIDYDGGAKIFPVDSLKDGQTVVRDILRTYRSSCQETRPQPSSRLEPNQARYVAHDIRRVA